MDTKKCNTCHEIKPLSEFYSSKTCKYGVRAHCIICNKKEVKEHYRNNIAQHRNQRYMVRYGITIEIYDEMLKSQDNKCAICKTTSPSRAKSGHFMVDHDHNTGVTRGLLCHTCNQILGFCKEDTEILDSAKVYLTKHILN